jgi:hypothetical protein
MNEPCKESYLFLQTSTGETLSCTDYEIIAKMIIAPKTFFATLLAHTVNIFVIIVQFSVPANITLSDH